MKKIKYIIPVVAISFLVTVASAQTGYTNHTLKTGETLSTLAKQYDTNVGDIMRLNGMHADTKLVYGSKIKIPSSKITKKETVAETQATKQTPTPSSNSFIHTVTKGETLFSISKKFNVPVQQLKSLNKLTGNSVKVGSTLLISNETAQKSSAQNTAAKNVTPQTVADEKKQIESVQQTAPDVASKSTTENNTANSSPNAPSNVTQQAVENNNAAAVEANTIQQNSVNNNAVVAEQQSTIAADQNNNTTSLSTKNVNGYFADQYQKSKRQKHVSGVSKTFKTASGWSDNKYYILANNIDPGTIVQLKADNGKSVFAKVLWNMGDMKENSGVDFRVSDATAAALNENDQQFNLTVLY